MNLSQLIRTILAEYKKLDDVRGLELVGLDTDVLGLHYGKLSLVPPLVDL